MGSPTARGVAAAHGVADATGIAAAHRCRRTVAAHGVAAAHWVAAARRIAATRGIAALGVAAPDEAAATQDFGRFGFALRSIRGQAVVDLGANLGPTLGRSGVDLGPVGADRDRSGVKIPNIEGLSRVAPRWAYAALLT